MEANQRRVIPRRKPLSDCTNTGSPSVSHKTNLTKSATTNLDNAPNPTSPQCHDIFHVQASEPVSAVYTRRPSSSKKRKDKGKAVAVPLSTTPNFKISHTLDDEFEGANLPKAKALTVPRRKKQRVLSSEKDAVKDTQLQDFIEERKAYFKEIDEFELLVEVESGDELD